MSLLEGPDCRLWIERLGDGVPVSVWAHGLTGSVDELRPLATHTAGTRVVMDLRGHGDSESPPESAGYDHPAMRTDVEAVADAVGATRAFGISTGAGAILNLLADRPDRFERVGLFLPASIDQPNESAAGLFPPLALQLEQMPLAQLAHQQETMDNPLFDARPYWRQLVRERTLRMNATGVPRALRAYVTGRPPVRDADLLRRVTAPVLILAHENDPVHDVVHARRLASLLPNARLEVWPETLGMYDDLDAFAALIGEFMSA
jgi:pimeloyl-ACP methyl ester carboxylesterase